MVKTEQIRGVKKEQRVTYIITKETANIIDKSECKNCYHVASCFYSKRLLQKCEEWLDTKELKRK